MNTITILHSPIQILAGNAWPVHSCHPAPPTSVSSKRIGVSAEPELVRVEVAAAQYSFLVLVSDGVCGQLTA
jgi:hypothetical protein